MNFVLGFGGLRLGYGKGWIIRVGMVIDVVVEVGGLWWEWEWE